MSISLKYRARGIYFALFNRGISFHHNEEYNPFFIVGSGRCGTTLLRRILTANDGIHIPPENWALGSAIRKFRKYHWHEDWDTLVDIIAADHCHSTQGWFENFPTTFVNKAKKCPKDKRSLSWLLDSFYRYHSEISEVLCSRWGDKTPLNVNHMDEILCVFPKAKFIHMIRDGVDVIHSWKNQGYYNDIYKPARRWHLAITSVKKFRQQNPNKCMEIRYEDLVQNPQKEVKKVCDFLTLSFDRSMLKVEQSRAINDFKKHEHYKNTLKPISEEHIGKGRQAFNKEERRKIGEMINNQLINLGYNPL